MTAETKDYSTAINPDATLARYEDEIKALEKQIDPLGTEWQTLVDKAIAGNQLSNEERQRKIELERQINPLREQLEEKRSQAREHGKTVRSAAGNPAWPSEGT